LSSLNKLRDGYTPKRYGTSVDDKRVLDFAELVKRCSKEQGNLNKKKGDGKDYKN